MNISASAVYSAVNWPKGFWHACELIKGLSAVEAEWIQLAGDEYTPARAFLRPTQELAESYPCTHEQPCGCYHRVVVHEDGDIVAICTCDYSSCNTIHLNRSDLVIYELDKRKVSDALTSALSLQRSYADLQNIPRTDQVGFDSPCAGFRFPVYLVMPQNRESFRSTVTTLAFEQSDPFILVTPTARMHESRCLDILTLRRSTLLTLADDFTLEPGGLILNTTGLAKIIRFHNDTVPALQPDSPEANPVTFFPTPSDATWGDVRIRFIDGHTVSVSVKGETGVYHYSQMGMAKKNSATPTAQWILLQAFAEGRGVFDWESEHADRTQKKQKQLLAQALIRFFRIDGDPFRYVKDFKGWETRFNIEPSS